MKLEYDMLTKNLPEGGKSYNLLGLSLYKDKDYNKSLVLTKSFCCSLFMVRWCTYEN